MNLTDVWPEWGDVGEQPDDGTDYEGGGNPKAGHFDHLWHQLRQKFGDVESWITTVETNLNDHESDQSNPHGVTEEQTGAAGSLDSHETSESGVHGIDTDDSVAAESDMNAVQSSLDSHESSTSEVHGVGGSEIASKDWVDENAGSRDDASEPLITEVRSDDPSDPETGRLWVNTS